MTLNVNTGLTNTDMKAAPLFDLQQLQAANFNVCNEYSIHSHLCLWLCF